MMKPLFVAIDAKYIHTNNAVRLLKANTSFDADILEFTIKDDTNTMAHRIMEKNPLFVGFSSYIWNIEIIKDLIKVLKYKADIPVILGGPEVSYDSAHFLNETQADLIVKGEGEHVIDDITRHFKYGNSLKGTPSIHTREINNPIKEIEDLTTLKSPHTFAFDIPHLKNRIAYIESSRGCPYKCSYCISSLEKTVRFFDINQVKDTILYLINNGVHTFKFLDRTFNANNDALDIIDFILTNHRKNNVFQFEMTGDTLNESIIDYIHENAPKGLFRFEIGIQSTHPLTNRLVGRHQNNERLFRVIRKIVNHDIIDLHLDLIAGLPEENLERFRQSFNEVFALGAKELQLGFLKMLRGTTIRHEAKQYEYVFDTEAPYEIISNHVLSKQDLSTIRKVESMLEIFHNKDYFGKTLMKIIHALTIDSFSFFLELYNDYQKNHLPLRGYQLHELYAFIECFLEKKGVKQEQLDELKHHYLKRFKTKPKLYFPKITDKKLRRTLINMLAEKTGFSENTLYKHTIITRYKAGYMAATYQNHTATIHTIENPK